MQPIRHQGPSPNVHWRNAWPHHPGLEDSWCQQPCHVAWWNWQTSKHDHSLALQLIIMNFVDIALAMVLLFCPHHAKSLSQCLFFLVSVTVSLASYQVSKIRPLPLPSLSFCVQYSVFMYHSVLYRQNYWQCCQINRDRYVNSNSNLGT